jgi:hypothetical protein
MQTNRRKYSSRTIAHENALKRSLFVNCFYGRHAILVAEVDPAAAPLFTVPSWKSFAPAHALNLDGPFRSVVSHPVAQSVPLPGTVET